MLSYNKLISYLKNQDEYMYSVKPLYVVVYIPRMQYHITIYQDQWDEYENVSNKPYHLFHISSNKEFNRCSSYFWVDKNNHRISKIPIKYFTYNQPIFNFFTSTRNSCKPSDVLIPLLKVFQKIINQAVYFDVPL